MRWTTATLRAMSTQTSNAPSATRRGDIHRWRNTLIATTRDAPSDAELPSHVLMSRAGFIRRVGAGIYSYLPLAHRTLNKLCAIIREELEAAGSMEMLMPSMEPMEFFAGSKRDVDYGDNLFRLTDRHGRVAALAPTHEEIITDVVKAAVTSYKQLPLNLYQIQTKFRDEFRPRAGLLRCREFLMKDAYSFHLDIEGEGGLDEVYETMRTAYTNIFQRCGLDFSAVEAESGPIGGSASHEFMVNCETGEDTIMVCPETGYAANVEKCEIGERQWSLDHAATAEHQEHHTPKMPGIDLVAGALGTTAAGMLKTLVMQPAEPADDRPAWVLVTVRGDHDVNEGKVRDALGYAVKMGDEKAAKEAGFAIGYVSPRMVEKVESSVLVIDHDAVNGPTWATGADKYDHHDTGFNWQRDMAGVFGSASATDETPHARVRIAEVRNAEVGDPSPRAKGARLEARRGIEVGHIFKLGDKYSKAGDFQIMDKDQKRRHVIMGCYGIGVSRTMAACVEMSHDDNGIVWPVPLAPYAVVITLIKPEDEQSIDTATTLAASLATEGYDVLIDDRAERPGVKFKDADLIGFPLRVTIGPKTLEQNSVEIKSRSAESEAELVAIDDALEACKRRL